MSGKPAANDPARPSHGMNPKRLPALVGLVAIGILVAGFSLWLLSARLAGAVQANGRVEVDKNRQILQHPVGGVVERLLVKSGDFVREGQVLLRLDTDDERSQLAIVEASYFDLLASRARLTAERDGARKITFPARLTTLAPLRPEVGHLMSGQTSLFEARRHSFAQEQAFLAMQARQIDAQRAGIEAQITALDRQAALIAEELHVQHRLRARGLAQSSRVLALEREKAAIEGRSGALRAQRALVTVQKGEIALSATRLFLQRRETVEAELENTRAKVIELAEREQHLLREIARRELRAPANGVIHEIMIPGERAVLRPAEPALSLIEQDRPLVIIARLAPINIDEVTLGQNATLRFPGLSTRSTLELTGELSRISPDIVTDPTNGASYYQIEVAFDTHQFDDRHKGNLVPGMPAEVFLRTTNNSPARYLLSPFLDFFAEWGTTG
ncbi:HlyD family type I secretion periplasmic adaptor subunit [Thioclava atlantica]|uniref:Membrane fusion protein (MFP) family protein n=1 Tax=Thioclava atlantica TaxID=1317124 RepID=A0A085TVW7_9RHOB|nr:HlyD family type I secretion periplasmic adaptor subunit [Thioclava atlantica]KFE34864.1 HlyD family type I secretion membrane fusion protein [Thioclava atlantica]